MATAEVVKAVEDRGVLVALVETKSRRLMDFADENWRDTHLMDSLCVQDLVSCSMSC